MKPGETHSHQFEEFIIRQNLVLLQTLQKWKITTDLPIENLTIRNATFFSWPRWAEAMSSNSDFPPLLPQECRLSPCLDAVESFGKELRKEFCWILSSDPIVIAVILNPFSALEVEEKLGLHYSGKPRQLFLISPTQAAELEAKAERLTTEEPDWHRVNPVEDMPVDRWFLNLQESDPKALVLPPSFYPNIGLECGVSDCLVVSQIKSNAWILTSHPPSVGLFEELLTVLKKQPRLFWVHNDYLKQLRRVAKPEVVLTKETDRIREWPNCPGLEPSAEGGVLVEHLLEHACSMGASDITITPTADSALVRIKVDGDYAHHAPLRITQYQSVLLRLKQYAFLNDQINNVPQDGSTHHKTSKGQRFDLRLNFLPVKKHGQSIAIRILDGKITKLASLNLGRVELETIRWFESLEGGMMVCTGPTGSGKTTTLYAILSELDTPAEKIITLEDPVEKLFEGSPQVEINDSISFSSALRACMRQDPNTILVGEIRDDTTANLAVQATLTGHKVLSTVHAPDAVGIFERMHVSFKISPQTLGYTLRLAIAQRLTPRNCPHCLDTKPAQESDLAGFPDVGIANPIVGKSIGCAACRETGILGRIPVLELFKLDRHVEELIRQNASYEQIKQYNRSRGFRSLGEQVATLVQTGQIPVRAGRKLMAS